jgi:hypothetical protein
MPIDPTRFIDLYFVIKKISWSVYEVNHPTVKGTLRLIGLPTNIFEIPAEMLPPGAPLPVISLTAQGIVAFINEGKKQPSGKPLSPVEFNVAAKEDITSYVTPRDEPFNEFVVQRLGKAPILVRTKTVLLKAEVLKDRYNVFGDPMLWINHNTSHSISECKEGEMYFP